MAASDRTVILILGGGTMQVPALKVARDRGWTVIMADGNPEPEGKPLAHYFENIDLRDVEGMISMAESYRRNTGIDGVFTAGTDFSLTVARVAEALGLPGISVDTAEKATYKDLMRSCFRGAKVPSPAFRTVMDPGDTAGILRSLPGPWVVKPVDNMGARGTRRVDDPGDLPGAVRAALSWSGSGKVIIEEYMEGPEYSIDAVVENGRITICGFADRHIRFSPYFIEMGHTMPARAPEKDVREVVRVFRLGVEALGIRDGCAKGDVKLTPDGGRVGEIAARLSGGYMSGWTFPYSSGVDLTGAAMNLAVGRGAGDLSPKYEMYSAERAFISVPGIVEGIEGAAEASRREGVMDVFLRAGPGDRVTFPRNNVEKCGNIISRAASREEAIRAAESAAASIRVRLMPGTEETGMYLFGKPEEGCPPAYDVRSGFLDRIRSMPALDGDEYPEGKPAGVGIVPLEGIENEPVVDWHGVSIRDGLTRVMESGYGYDGGASGLRLGSLFWRAFLRGGSEAGIWMIRTFLEDPRHALKNVRLWSED